LQHLEQSWSEDWASPPERRDWLVPLLLALLIHLGLFLIIPDQLMPGIDLSETEESSVELTLLPSETLPPEDMQYVEVNPEAPENTPDETNQYSFRDQQAANLEESSVLLEAPNIDGELEDSNKIVQGAVEPTPPLPEGVYTTQAKPGEGEGTEGGKAGAQAVAEALVAPVARPAPDFLQQEAETEDGTGSSLEMVGPAEELFENPDPNAPIDLYQPPAQTSPATAQTQQGDGSGGSPDAVPRARPRLSPDLIHGPLAKSQGSAPRRGQLGLDATFSEFGEYEQQFYAALQAGWYQEIEFFQPIDTATRVVVRFKILSDGTIVGTEVVSSNASEVATLICETAITKRSPFRPWTKEMIQVFGNERVLTVSFRYL
jgi:hypothetical protein